MPARATQPPGYAPGVAQVQVVGLGAVDAGTLELCVSGMVGTVEKHLDPRLATDAWTTALVWFRPGRPRIEGPALVLDLEPSVTWHLRPHSPYVLRLRDATGLKREERLTWIAIRLPSQAPAGYVAPAAPAAVGTAAAEAARAAEAAAEAETEALARQVREAQAAEATRVQAAEQAVREKAEAERRRREEAERARPVAQGPAAQGEDTPRRSKGLVFGIVAVLLLGVIGGGLWFFRDTLFPPGEEVASVTPAPAPLPAPVPTTLQGARQFLAKDPGGDESFGLAETFGQARQLDGQFLLLRHAANKGSAPAALALGQMYDPATWSAETSPLPSPNPAQAVEWYTKAADAGIAEAQYRLGVLLMSGKTDMPNGPELGVGWLQKAAAQGHQAAKDALPK